MLDKEIEPIKFKSKRSRVAYALLTTKTIKQASEVSGVSERTIYRWKVEDEKFRHELERIESMAIAAADVRINLLQHKAVRVLEELLDDEGVSDSIRLQTAKLILAKRNQYHFYEEDEKRLEIRHARDPYHKYLDSLSDEELAYELMRKYQEVAMDSPDGVPDLLIPKYYFNNEDIDEDDYVKFNPGKFT